ncbi:MAG TPA: hypothetical protein IAA27_04620 [Candidatus Enterococcus stercoravium]|nr:hypothetical protein [Candidatus Enterococcus stercoravium]
MSYQTIYTELASLASQAKTIGENLNKELELNMSRYIGDLLQEKNAKVDSDAKAQITSLATRAQAELNTGLSDYQRYLDANYFASITPNEAAEIDMIANSNLDIDEVKAYFRKFSGNKTLLRRLEKIATDSGFLVLGRTYRGELDFMNSVKNAGQNIVDAITSGEGSRLSIATNYMAGKVQEYDAFSNKETQVIQK